MSTDKIFKPRRYLHFDEPLSESSARKLATDPARIKSWAFMPMLKWTSTIRKVKRLPGNKVEKKEPKERPICYAAHKDASIYAYYSYILTELYEKALVTAALDTMVSAFRPKSGKCNIHFAKDAFDWIRLNQECVALAFDIKGFFDHLDHQILKRQWAFVLGGTQLPPDHYGLFKSLTKFATVERAEVFKALGISKHKPRANCRRRLCTPDEYRSKVRDAGLVSSNPNAFGIPQGSPMSAILSNVYMLPFDSSVSARVLSVGGFYRRYCDDILCIVPHEHESNVENFVMQEIAGLKLEIQASKTLRHHFHSIDGVVRTDRELQYLGFMFNGHRVLLRDAGVSRFYSKMRAGIRLAASMKKKADKKLRPGEDSTPIKRRKLNIKYSYIGQKNYPAYVFRAARIFGDKAIKRQIRRHWGKLNSCIATVEKKLKL